MRLAAGDRAARRGGAGGFARNEGGASAVMFALSLPVVLLAIAVAIDYSNASRFKTRVQAAADAASLAATEAIAQNPNGANGKTVEQYAQQVANGFFAANAPPGASGTPTVTASSYNSTVTTTVAYQGTAPSNFGALLGYSGMTADASATAQAVVGESSKSNVGATHYSGYGVIGGDPHVYGFDNNDYYLACTQPGQTTWINVLSDSGIEINASCVYNTYFAMDSLQTVTILLGSHVISTTAALPSVPYEYGPITYNAATAWFGQVTIDGVTYPAVKGTRTLLDQAVTNGSLTVIQYVSDTTNFYFVDNAIYINTPVYNITLSYQDLAMADLWITATNAGACGVPGGALGATLAGVDDATGGDFTVSGATATTYQFGWSTCPLQVNNSAASVTRLIK